MHIVIDARLVRRVIKHQRGLSDFGLQVPHGHCCVVERAPLLSIVTESELGCKISELPATVILVARPEVDDAHRIWRRSFHGFVHHHLEERVRAGTLTHAVVRSRINSIGQTEFDEIRAVLHGEELLFSKGDDREAYIEFAAFYLELLHFDPEALDEFFPSIRHAGPVALALAGDVDVSSLLEPCRPPGAADLAPTRAAVASLRAPQAAPHAPRRSRPGEVASANAARKRGNVVRSMLVRMAAGDGASDDLDELAHRLEAALRVSDPALQHAPSIAAWLDVIRPLAEAATRADSPRSLEARVLHDLQKACVDAERGRNAVDVVTWLASAFRRPIVRPLPVVRVVRVARHLQHAFANSHRAALSKVDRKRLEHVFHAALACAKENARRAIKPALERSIDDVGLAPTSVPERVAREKLCEEILDLVLARGSLGLSQLRDALSRSNLKLPNLRPAELATGDPLLRADALLASSLDGVYRRGEIYLRFLQRVSSVAFGTQLGRLVTLHVALPLLLSFVLLEGLQHLAHPIGRALGYHHVHLLTLPSFAVGALFFYGVIHNNAVRSAARAILRGVGSGFHAIFIGLPGLVLSSAPVRAVLRGRTSSLVAKPLLIGGAVYVVARAAGLERTESVIATCGFVLATALFLGTSVGLRVDEAVTDLVLRRVRELSRRVLPGAFALVVDVFRIFVERVERAIYTVDEWLTFKEGESKLSLATKGVLGFGWFFVTYLLRIYVNVLIEPQINPIKHFPVVTVSHKIILPMSPTILGAVRGPLAPLGAVASNAIAASTVFLLPGAFGFLVWELKENWNLYHQNRSKKLEPVRMGHHGETMNGLLVPGFHVGTLPKLFAKLRRATKRGEAKVNEYRAKLREVEHALETFVERELVGLLRESKRWGAGDLVVHAIEVGSNRIRIGVVCLAVAPDVAWIHFEQQSGLLVASLAMPGFIALLPEGPRATFETALAGLYKRSGVDIVREQVESLLGRGTLYDIAAEGLVVWPNEGSAPKADGYETDVVYDLAATGTLEGVVRGVALPATPVALDADRLLFKRQDIQWTAWVDAFREDPDHDAGPRSRVIDGPSLIALG